MFQNVIYSVHLGRPGEYNIHGNLISPSDSVKDLGVFIDDKLKFHIHTASVIAKAIYVYNCTLAMDERDIGIVDKTKELLKYMFIMYSWRTVIQEQNTTNVSISY